MATANSRLPSHSSVRFFLVCVAAWASLALLACERDDSAPVPDPAPTPTAVVEIAPPIDPVTPTPRRVVTQVAPVVTRVAPVQTLKSQRGIEIDEFDFAPVGQSNNRQEIKFTARVVNKAPSGSESPIRVEAIVDGVGPKEVATIESATAGDSITTTFTELLGPGEHEVEVRVGDSTKRARFSVLGADIEVTILPYWVRHEGWITLPIAIANRGEIYAEGVELLGSWGPAPEAYLGRNTIFVALGAIGPNTEEIVKVPVVVPAGSFNFKVSGRTASIESVTDNNSTQSRFKIRFDQLRLRSPSPPRISYQGTQPLADIRLVVNNPGEKLSGVVRSGVLYRSTVDEFGGVPAAIAAIPQCKDKLAADCWWEAKRDLVRPGESQTIDVRLELEPGSYSLVGFVGSPEYGSRWSADSTIELDFVIVPRPAFAISAAIDASVRGYWSDGTATVEVTASLSNFGYEPKSDPFWVSLACRQPEQSADLCRSKTELTFDNGFGPTIVSAEFRTRMGQALELELAVDGKAHSSIPFAVPERIVGVERYVWDCYSAREGYQDRSAAVPLGCGAWRANRVDKWWQQHPVKVWSTGDPEYLAVLERALADLAPLLNLEFENVSRKEDAEFPVYVGVSRDLAPEIGLGCINAGGCATWGGHHSTGVINSAINVVWEGSHPAKAIYHEILHSMMGIVHLPVPGALMGAPLSIADVALIRLNSNPLIEPGMTMSEVRKLIVLRDELLDPAGPSAYETLWRSAVALQMADSAAFDLSSEWIGDQCRLNDLPAATYEVGGYLPSDPDRARFQSLDHEYWYADGGYWTFVNGNWGEIAGHVVLQDSGWLHRHYDPMIVFDHLLSYGGLATFGLVESDAEALTFTSAAIPTPDNGPPITDATFVLQRNTLRPMGFAWTVPVNRDCSVSIMAANARYGSGLRIPESIASQLESG